MSSSRRKQEQIYQAALLKIAVKMRTNENKSFEQILRETIKDMLLDENKFRRYVASNMQVLLTTAKKR